MGAVLEIEADNVVNLDEIHRRETLIIKGDRDLRGAIANLVQAQSMMFAYATERNIAESIQHFEKLEIEIRNIGKESANIKQILLKTRILSINASVEAARVGNAGKGFGIVASEIGSLSNQTEVCTDEVDMISRRLFEQARVSNATMDKLKRGMNGFAGASGDMMMDTLKLVTIEENGFILTLLAKRLENHADFMRNLIKNAGGTTKLSDHHTCAFGKWYDQNEKKYRHIRGYKEIYETHKKFHTTAIEFNKSIEIDALTKLVTLSSEILSEFITLAGSFRAEMQQNHSYFQF